MGLFGSLFTGVSALFAQSQSTAIVSNNIANVSTIGFKRSEASFNSLVTTESRLSQYSPGTVTVNRIQRVDQQGAIQQTSSATDAAISGNGFFPVKRSTDFGQEFLYTRAGQFSEDAQGLLRNAAGFVLYAWPIDSQGELPANQGDLSSLVPADVAFLGGLTRPTNTADLAINLDADQAQTVTNDPTDFPLSGTPPDFSRGLTVFDSLGSSQNITLEYRKITGPMANITSQNTVLFDDTSDIVAAELGGVAVGDAMDITVGGNTLRVEFLATSGAATTAPAPGVGTLVGVASVQELLTAIDTYNFGGASPEVGAELVDGQIRMKALNPATSFTVSDAVGTPVSAANGLNYAGGAVNTADPLTDFLSGLNDGGVYPENNQTTGGFPQFTETTTPNTQGWWELKIIHPDGSTISEGLLNFDSNGSLNANRDSDGNIDIELNNIDWGNGSSLQDININVERFSQFAGNYDVIFADQDGAELGLRTGVELTRDGTVVARFSNGASADLYQVPLVTFANQNGLTEVSGTAYTESEESGEENLRQAGTGGAGFVEPSTLEASNVDLANEFAVLIVSQRAFGAGTRVINTVDQMTEDLLRLR